MVADWSSLMWLLVVLAAIPAALWFVKRTPLGQSPVPGSARTVAVLGLTANQRVVTVEVGRGEQRLWLVLGVGPQGISNLYTMAPQDDGPAAAAPPPNAAAALEPLLQRLRRNRRDGDAR